MGQKTGKEKPGEGKRDKKNYRKKMEKAGNLSDELNVFGYCDGYSVLNRNLQLDE